MSSIADIGRRWRDLVHDPRAFARKVVNRVRRRPRLKRRFREQLGGTVAEWLYFHHRHVIKGKQVTWMGVPALKSVLDAWIYQEILYQVRPAVIVEIGSWMGGSTLYLAHLLDILGDGRVVSVDIDRTPFRVKHPRIVEITGDSGAAETVAAVTQLCHDRSTLVIHDGAHRSDRVLRDLLAYAPLVTPGSYLIVEDGIVDAFVPGRGIGETTEGPLGAIEEFLRRCPEFVPDRSRERYRITYNPMGYLKRLR